MPRSQALSATFVSLNHGWFGESQYCVERPARHICNLRDPEIGYFRVYRDHTGFEGSFISFCPPDWEVVGREERICWWFFSDFPYHNLRKIMVLKRILEKSGVLLWLFISYDIPRSLYDHLLNGSSVGIFPSHAWAAGTKGCHMAGSYIKRLLCMLDPSESRNLCPYPWSHQEITSLNWQWVGSLIPMICKALGKSSC